MIDRPTFSIVMPSFQQARFLEEAARSVLEQEGVSVELLVMDPGSTDGSRELLLMLKQEFGERLRLYFEPDNGQSDAINKGMGLARGEILCWLNSDDRFRPGALAQVAESLKTEAPAWLYGRVGMIDGEGREISSFITRYKSLRGRRFSILKLLSENFISQMGVFWTRAMWLQAGGLAEEKHLDMDYDLWLRFARVAPPVVLSEPLADFRVHASAKGSLQTAAQLRDAYATAREHAVGYGWRGQLALLLHRVFGWRTLLAYRLLKP